MNLHMYQVNLAKYGNKVYHMAVRIYSGLLTNLKPSQIIKISLKPA
jgi:hypothetical protein